MPPWRTFRQGLTARRCLGVAAICAVLLCAAATLLASRAHRGLSSARSLAGLRHWAGVRNQLERYLWLYPSSDEAHLLMAEALIKDESLSSELAVARALQHLARIEDDSPFGASARTQEGRLHLFLMNQPARAERKLRRALELSSRDLDAHYVLWKNLDLSGRSHLTEDLFWNTYGLTSEADQPERLREWYMSQFYPTTASPTLDRLLGFIRPGESSDNRTEFRRLLAFRNAEPEEPLGHASLAHWFLQSNDPHHALRLLEEAAAKLDNELENPWFIANLVAARYELGKFSEADDAFRNWPEPRTGHEYWKWKAIILDEIRGEFEAALEAYDRALDTWPGHVDWRLRFRKATCLARLRRQKEAENERERGKAIELMLHDDVHRRLRAALGSLERTENLEQVADFYRRLNRPREAAEWARAANRLRSPREAENR